MSPGKINERVFIEKIAWIDRMISEIRSLPLDSLDTFMGDSRNVWAAESCLRRALEGLMDLGRHLLAKGFGQGVTEYKQIGPELLAKNVLTREESDLLVQLAGYRNRIVHYYHEITPEELFRISRDNLGDITKLVKAVLAWKKTNPDLIDKSL